MSRNAHGAGTIRQRPNGRWEARITIGRDTGTGKQIQKSIYGDTQSEVRKKLQAACISVDNNAYTAPTKLTVSKWLDIWLNDYVISSVKPFTYKSYETQCRVHIVPALGAIPLQVLNTHTIQTFYNGLSKRGLSPKTIKNIHGVLHKALDKAVKIGYINSNASVFCELPMMIKKEISPLTENNIKDFLKALENEEYSTLYITTLFTGVREGEILGLTWDCINFKDGTITINKQLQREKKTGGKYILSPTKNSNNRVITPASYVMNILVQERKKQAIAKLKAGSLWDNSMNLVFTNVSGQHLATHTVYKRYKKIVANIGIPNARFHDLRHTYAVTALQEGDNIKTVQEALGHATASFTLDVYGHVSDKMKKESANRMDNFIRNIQ